MHTSIEGGSSDKEATEVAVIACLFSPFFADTTVTVEIMPRMAWRNSLLTGSRSMVRQIIMSTGLNLL